MVLKPSADIRKNLRSAQYLMYMQTFLARAKKLETENTLFTDGLKAFEAAVAEVDASVRIATKSKMTINVTEADAVRDRLYSLLKSVVVGLGLYARPQQLVRPAPALRVRVCGGSPSLGRRHCPLQPADQYPA